MCPRKRSRCVSHRTRRCREEIPSHMFAAVLTTLFCCQIGGIIAIVYAAQVNTLLACGKIEEARNASEAAKMWITLSVIPSAVLLVVAMIACVFRH